MQISLCSGHTSSHRSHCCTRLHNNTHALAALHCNLLCLLGQPAADGGTPRTLGCAATSPRAPPRSAQSASAAALYCTAAAMVRTAGMAHYTARLQLPHHQVPGLALRPVWSPSPHAAVQQAIPPLPKWHTHCLMEVACAPPAPPLSAPPAHLPSTSHKVGLPN